MLKTPVARALTEDTKEVHILHTRRCLSLRRTALYRSCMCVGIAAQVCYGDASLKQMLPHLAELLESCQKSLRSGSTPPPPSSVGKDNQEEVARVGVTCYIAQ